MFNRVIFISLISLSLTLIAPAGEYFAGQYYENPADAMVQLEQAEAAFKALIAGLPEFEQAETYEQQGNHGGAEDIYKTIVTDYPGTDYALEAQKKLAMLYISRDRLQEANAAFNELITSFSGHKLIPGTVYRIAEHATRQEEHTMAGQLYQHIINNWPQQYYEIWAQVVVVKSDLSLGNTGAAEAATNKLLADFHGNVQVAGAVCGIAQHYHYQLGNYEKAKQLYQYIIDNWPEDEYAMWCQFELAQVNIALGDTEAAQAATEKFEELLPNFTKNDESMAERACEAAQQYIRSGEYEKAKQLYQYALDYWPEAKYAMWTKIGLAQARIRLGENAVAETIIDGLVAKLNADYPLDSKLPPIAGQTCYDAGNLYRQLDKYQKSILCHQRVVANCPDHEYAWNAQYTIGLNYEILKKSEAISVSEADTKIRAAYEQLLARYPDCPGAAHAREWLNLHNTP